MPHPHDGKAITDNVSMRICTIEEAPNYNKMDPKPTGVIMTDVIVVKEGMQSGVPSFDLIFVDDSGKQYVTMVTGNLMRHIMHFSRHEFDGRN